MFLVPADGAQPLAGAGKQSAPGVGAPEAETP